MNQSYFHSFPVTSSILFFNTVIFILLFLNMIPQEMVISFPHILSTGTFLAHFSHIDFLHFAMNMVITYRFFPLLESELKSSAFFLFFLLLWGLLIGFLWFLSQTPLIGFSGILMGGMAFLFGLFRLRHHPFSQSLFVLIVANIFIGFMPGISFWGHFCGALAGAILFGIYWFFQLIRR